MLLLKTETRFFASDLLNLFSQLHFCYYNKDIFRQENFLICFPHKLKQGPYSTSYLHSLPLISLEEVCILLAFPFISLRIKNPNSLLYLALSIYSITLSQITARKLFSQLLIVLPSYSWLLNLIQKQNLHPQLNISGSLKRGRDLH